MTTHSTISDMETKLSAPEMTDEIFKNETIVHDAVKDSDSSSQTTAVGETGEKQELEDTASPLPPQGPQEGDALNDHLTGFKLAALLFSTGLVFFTLLLDNSIISTVCDGFPSSSRLSRTALVLRCCATS